MALSGKMLACTNLGITMTCLADGRRIGFMEDSDIYALFGNILDNAIEATKTVTEEEKRIISLTIGTTGDLLLIDSQNYYAGEVQFVDGLPQTSKENKEYHGFRHALHQDADGEVRRRPENQRRKTAFSGCRLCCQSQHD